MSQAKYTIKQLAELADVSRRTVRYYVQRGLLSPPLGSGRGSHYTEQHLQRLIEIRDAQTKGIPLADIDSPQPSQPLPAALPMEIWVKIKIANGVELHLCNQQLSDETIQKIQKTISLLISNTTEQS